MTENIKPRDVPRDYSPIVRDLQAVGFSIVDIDGLHAKNANTHAVDVILKHLLLPHPAFVKYYISTKLNGKHSLPRRSVLVDFMRQFAKEEPRHDPRVSFSLAVAVAATTNSSNLDETISLVQERDLGLCRVGLLAPIKRRRNKDEHMKALVAKLKEDPDLCREIARWR